MSTQPAGPYSIGSDLWPGLSKLIEECGEVLPDEAVTSRMDKKYALFHQWHREQSGVAL